MKSKSLLIAMLFGLAISTTACKKCQTCTYGTDEMEVCRTGVYSQPSVYNSYIQTLENQGYDCK